jgi:phosphoribosylanthranilate isomerase
MLNSVLKVCRVETPLGAKLAAYAGANFVGLHVIDEQTFSAPRVETLHRIVSFLKYQVPHCLPVMVTRSSDAGFLAMARAAIGVDIIQLHQSLDSLAIVEHIKNAARMMGMSSPALIKNIVAKDLRDRQHVRAWSNAAYAILLDANDRGGTGQVIDWNLAEQMMQSTHHSRTFIAGGLGPDNVGRALQCTGAWGADAQTRLEVQGQKKPHMKNVEEVLGMVAAVHSLPYKQARKVYCLRHARPRFLFSPTEMTLDDARVCLHSLISTSIDGIQIDCSDETAGVPRWPIDAETWAAACWEIIPEAPIWLHCFSKDTRWIIEQIDRVQQKNRHLVGLFVQDGRDASQGLEIARSIEKERELAIGISLSCEQAHTAKPVLEDGILWQITAPRRTEGWSDRVAEAIEVFQRESVWVNIDRGITIDLVSSLRTKPNGVTIGRGLMASHTPVQQSLDKIAVVLGSI